MQRPDEVPLNHRQQDALRQICEDLGQRLQDFAESLTGRAYADRAKDLVQDTYLRLARHLDLNGTLIDAKGHAINNIYQYARQTLKNLFWSSFSDDDRNHDQLDEIGCDDFNPVLRRLEREAAEKYFSTERGVLRYQSTPSVRQLVVRLPHSLREIFIMRMYEDMSFSEISQRTGIELDLCKYMMNLARAKLRYVLKLELQRLEK